MNTVHTLTKLYVFVVHFIMYVNQLFHLIKILFYIYTINIIIYNYSIIILSNMTLTIYTLYTSITHFQHVHPLTMHELKYIL